MVLRILLYMIGIMVMPFGVVLTINSHMGAGGYDALNFALGETLHIKTSYAIYLTAAFAVIITAIIRRGFPRITTFISSILLGISTDIWKSILEDIQATTMLQALILLIVGVIFIGVAVASYMHSMFPTNPTDDMIVAMKEKGISIRVAKIGFDVFCIMVAWIFGGEIGAGTILITLLLGPVIDLFYNLIFKVIKLSNKKETC
ncbi:MAG TPA: membrane protein [Candidatus Merdenecus merdavium]|nr:membrane protein [Candidatus Merdenecus merdavium]